MSKLNCIKDVSSHIELIQLLIVSLLFNGKIALYFAIFVFKLTYFKKSSTHATDGVFLYISFGIYR
jgi:hypothetical protein